MTIPADSLRVRVLCSELAALIREYERHADSTTAQGYYSNPKLTGAIRRKSMDLTRALAEMRRA